MKVTAFLPCRKGSERVPKKNIKPFAGFEYGLIALKLSQLLNCHLIDEIVLSTNDEEILNYATQLRNHKIKTHRRKDELCTSTTSTDELVGHAADLIPNGHILWTHVTSPFITSKVYESIVKKYFEMLENGHDSLMTTTLIHSFLWNEQGPVNYNRILEKWPRTQTISPIHEINSGAFLSSSLNYVKLKDRIGLKPFLYPLDKITAHDIDWDVDFTIAESIAMNGLAPL